MIRTLIKRAGGSSILFLLLSRLASGQEALPGSGIGGSAGAGSRFSDYDASLVVYKFLAAVLVFGILAGAFLILNMGLLSKRPEDRTGHRDPSDLEVFQNQVWPNAEEDKAVLPAAEDMSEEQQYALRLGKREEYKKEKGQPSQVA